MAVFSKKYPTFFDWLKSRRIMNAYVGRIIAYLEANPEATLKDARGRHPEPKFYYRTSFVLKLPVASEWKIVRRSIIRKSPVNTDAELERFLRHAGKFFGSQPYAYENRAYVGIEDNVEIPADTDSLGEETDDYDEGST